MSPIENFLKDALVNNLRPVVIGYRHSQLTYVSLSQQQVRQIYTKMKTDKEWLEQLINYRMTLYS